MTYKEIQESYKELYGTTVKSCWIADVKRELGLTKRQAYNRINGEIAKYPCRDESVRIKLKEIILK